MGFILYEIINYYNMLSNSQNHSISILFQTTISEILLFLLTFNQGSAVFISWLSNRYAITTIQSNYLYLYNDMYFVSHY